MYSPSGAPGTVEVVSSARRATYSFLVQFLVVLRRRGLMNEFGCFSIIILWGDYHASEPVDSSYFRASLVLVCCTSCKWADLPIPALECCAHPALSLKYCQTILFVPFFLTKFTPTQPAILTMCRTKFVVRMLS